MPPTEALTTFGPGGPGRDVSLAQRLAPSRTAAHRARHAIKGRFGDLLAEETLDDVLLVVSELVSNAVLYGTGEIGVRVAYDGRSVTGEVSDEGSGFARQLRDRGRVGFGGHGLHLVGRLTQRWGLREGSSHVWFEIPRRQL